ncbi:DUF4232 domain-containing protein [uncultured Amnibacterium sp.]|uniref:DUF4232 domain-containing protein n=1 Tax=uncultured Amnibacterium sp. TaxID=1631851 RepID=UPI0035C99573
MAPEHEHPDRDTAVRAMLVGQVAAPLRRAAMSRERVRDVLVTAAVLVVVVALSVIAIRSVGDRGGPADGGAPATSSAVDALPTPTLTAGKPLGRFTSDDGPVQRHVIRPDGLAVATVIECSGPGSYLFSIARDGSQGGDGGCGGGVTSGNKGVAGSTTVTIRTDKRMTWTLTIVGIPETYVTPRPIPTPTDTAGTAVRYCTADDLTARFVAGAEPKGVTEVSGGDLVFTNASDSTCALAGYPEVRFLLDGAALGRNTMNHIDERSSTEDGLHAVLLRPGGVAYSQIDWYLANYYPENEEGRCAVRTVSAVQVDLAYDLSSPGQTGTLTVPIGTATACLNGEHGALGKYGQVSSTVFVDYPTARR